MKTLQEDIQSRLHEILPDNDQSTAFGLIQWEDAERALLQGRVLVVFRRPGSIPVTHVLPRR